MTKRAVSTTDIDHLGAERVHFKCQPGQGTNWTQAGTSTLQIDSTVLTTTVDTTLRVNFWAASEVISL